MVNSAREFVSLFLESVPLQEHTLDLMTGLCLFFGLQAIFVPLVFFSHMVFCLMSSPLAEKERSQGISGNPLMWGLPRGVRVE